MEGLAGGRQQEGWGDWQGDSRRGGGTGRGTAGRVGGLAGGQQEGWGLACTRRTVSSLLCVFRQNLFVNKKAFESKKEAGCHLSRS
jgi:hypothetical protein